MEAGEKALEDAEWAEESIDYDAGNNKITVFYCPVCHAEKTEGHTEDCPIGAWRRKLVEADNA